MGRVEPHEEASSDRAAFERFANPIDRVRWKNRVRMAEHQCVGPQADGVHRSSVQLHAATWLGLHDFDSHSRGDLDGRILAASIADHDQIEAIPIDLRIEL